MFKTQHCSKNVPRSVLMRGKHHRLLAIQTFSVRVCGKYWSWRSCYFSFQYTDTRLVFRSILCTSLKIRHFCSFVIFFKYFNVYMSVMPKVTSNGSICIQISSSARRSFVFQCLILCHLFLCFIIPFIFFLFLVNLFWNYDEKKPLMWTAYSDKSACSIISGGSGSIGGNSTATLGNDLPSLTPSEDFPEEIEFSTNYGKATKQFLN